MAVEIFKTSGPALIKVSKGGKETLVTKFRDRKALDNMTKVMNTFIKIPPKKTNTAKIRGFENR